MNKNYLVILVACIAVLFALFVFVFASTEQTIQFSPTEEAQSNLFGFLQPAAAFFIGILIVVISALLVLIGIER